MNATYVILIDIEKYEYIFIGLDCDERKLKQYTSKTIYELYLSKCVWMLVSIHDRF